MKKYRFAASLALAALLMVIVGGVRAGMPFGSRFVIENDVTVSEEESAIAYNSQRQEYLVVWQEGEIWGHRVSKYGTLIGSAFRISPTNEGSYPDVAYNSDANEYLVVWQNMSDVRGQRVSAFGALQGGVIDVALGSLMTPAYYYDQPAVDYASVANCYLVTFRYRTDLDGSSGIWAQVLTSGGSLDGGQHQISAQSNTALPEQPDVAYNRSRNELLIVWQEIVLGDIDVYGRRFKLTGGAGTQGSEFPIGNMASDDDIAPAVAAIPTVPTEGQYLVVWESDTGSDYNIAARTVSWDGTLGTWRDLANTPWSEHRPAVAGCESCQEFLAVWTWVPVITPPGMMQVQGKTLALDGASLHDTVTVGGGQVFDVAVAAGPTGDFLITFDDNEVIGIANRGIYAWRWGNRVYLPLLVRQ